MTENCRPHPPAPGRETILVDRVSTTDEIAKAAALLASDDSSFVNGVELFADGGMTQV